MRGASTGVHPTLFCPRKATKKALPVPQQGFNHPVAEVKAELWSLAWGRQPANRGQRIDLRCFLVRAEPENSGETHGVTTLVPL
jgi:hypothetical protein